MIELRLIAKENGRTLTHCYEIEGPLVFSHDDEKIKVLLDALKKDFGGTHPDITIKAVL